MRVVERVEIGCPPTGSIQDEQLTFQENRFCNDGAYTSRPGNTNDGNNDVEKNNDQITHRRMLAEVKISCYRGD